METVGMLFSQKRLVMAASLAIVALAMMATGQNQLAYSRAEDMPLERVADSYAIYQQVLPSDSIEWSDVQRTQWLLQDVTTAKPLSSSCEGAEMTDLSKAVVAPSGRKAEWDEVLADYVAHCHDSYKLNSSYFKLAIPVRLLDKEAQARYWHGVGGMPPKGNIMQAPPTPSEFQGAAGLHSFSAVYFNRGHTLAATYFGMGCGSLCGNWKWVVLEKIPNGWRRLPWVHVDTFS